MTTDILIIIIICFIQVHTHTLTSVLIMMEQYNWRYTTQALQIVHSAAILVIRLCTEAGEGETGHGWDCHGRSMQGKQVN